MARVPFLLQLFSIVFLFEREEEICGDLGAGRFEFEFTELGALLRLLFGSAVECSIEVLIWFCSSVSANCLKTADKWGLFCVCSRCIECVCGRCNFLVLQFSALSSSLVLQFVALFGLGMAMRNEVDSNQTSIK
ncbi:hypothetical protein RHMOL_Rhmol04G0109000 [Rhododendron molle]|uniref:Uncharacterized protein n=1 Tax=Rhododendron molle TaxID=49168 RepID=A0ACC0P1J9_RHOML|nr:hypothetical protein RHMOL_Rhmol04G0109000 [Rhododendron molle]